MKILWAVDCFGGSQLTIKAGAQFLSKLSQSLNSEVSIIPVAIMGPMEFQWFIDANLKDSPQHYLERIIRKFSLNGLEYPKVISDSGFSLTASAKALEAFGRKHKCDLILCMTRSKPGIKSAFLGSFAESLATRSKTPLFLVHPDGVSKFHTRSIVFSTDLSPGSKAAFKKLLPFAKAFGSSIEIVHCAFQQSDWATALAMVESFQYLSGLPLDFKESTFKREQKWFEDTAKKAQLKAKLSVSKHYSQIAEEVVRFARSKSAGILALATHSGPISAALLGSNARRILRLSSRPVLVLR